MACYSMGFKWSCHFDPVFFLFPHFEISSNQRGPNNARSTIVQDTINSSSTWMTHLVLAACFKTLMIVLTTRKIRCFWPQDSCTAMFLSIDGRMLAPMPRCFSVPGQTHRLVSLKVSALPSPPRCLDRRLVCKLNRPCALYYMHGAPRFLSLARSLSYYHACIAR